MNKNNSHEEPNKIRQLQLFPIEFGVKPAYYRFLQSDLGQLWQKIPFDSLAQSIVQCAKKQGSHVPQWGWFNIQGALASQVLKSYYNGLSDEKLLEKLNQCEVYQWFCFMQLKGDEQIKDKDIFWRWRMFLGSHMDLDSLNVVQLQAWKGEIEHPHFRMGDATAYEVFIAYPTSVKLLWQSCEWIYDAVAKIGKSLGLGSLKREYRHYEDQLARQRSYEKSRRKTHAQTLSRIRQLLFWLNKGLDLIKPLLVLHQQKSEVEIGFRPLKERFISRFETIEKVYDQQKQLFDNPKESIKDRIVSLHQPHIRPIVRGKELKRVEFGPKVHMLRIGGINLIEKFSFDNFNEGTRFEKACTAYDELTGKCHQFGADQIYATNSNRRFATQNHIATCFKVKGKLPADEDKKQDKIKAIQTIHTIRATHMEGSFGNEKQHYDLLKIKTKTPETQLAYLFCAILTANAMTLVGREKKRNKQLAKMAKSKPTARAA